MYDLSTSLTRVGFQIRDGYAEAPADRKANGSVRGLSPAIAALASGFGDRSLTSAPQAMNTWVRSVIARRRLSNRYKTATRVNFFESVAELWL